MASFKDTAIQLVIAWWLLLGALAATPEFFPFGRIIILTVAAVTFTIAGYVFAFYASVYVVWALAHPANRAIQNFVNAMSRLR